MTVARMIPKRKLVCALAFTVLAGTVTFASAGTAEAGWKTPKCTYPSVGDPWGRPGLSSADFARDTIAAFRLSAWPGGINNWNPRLSLCRTTDLGPINLSMGAYGVQPYTAWMIPNTGLKVRRQFWLSFGIAPTDAQRAVIEGGRTTLPADDGRMRVIPYALAAITLLVHFPDGCTWNPAWDWKPSADYTTRFRLPNERWEQAWDARAPRGAS